ncbi:hypothetical protein [Aureimonas sp. AU22]|uniref:hypothetical protein n=1 Tax=Aureimonas sp. AU22 TaxID=1638162 RepID=UPI0012E369BC|nr:hypothetical protein [Aureimonas sp. AU22]
MARAWVLVTPSAVILSAEALNVVQALEIAAVRAANGELASSRSRAASDCWMEPVD